MAAPEFAQPKGSAELEGQGRGREGSFEPFEVEDGHSSRISRETLLYSLNRSLPAPHRSPRRAGFLRPPRKPVGPAHAHAPLAEGEARLDVLGRYTLAERSTDEATDQVLNKAAFAVGRQDSHSHPI
eukprot:scaffold57202_cov48-Phaeocystis_antarctica.AAC.1